MFGLLAENEAELIDWLC